MTTFVLFLIFFVLFWIGYWLARLVMTIEEPVGVYHGLPIWRALPYMALMVLTLIVLTKLA
jgi:hypothetical protein